MPKKQKLLIVSPGTIPTVDIIVRTLSFLRQDYQIKIILEHRICLKWIFSGEYKILFIRQCNPSLQPLLKLMEQFKIPYLYYLDDNLWEIKGDTPLGRLYQNPIVKETLTHFIKNASYIIVGSRHLKNYVKQFNRRVVYIKTAFSFELIEDIKQDSNFNVIKILYSGTLYRDEDFKFVIPALKKILAEYPGKIKICFNGFVPNALKNTPDVIFDEHFYPYDDYIKKQYQGNYAIGLAPLTASLSNYSKTNLKYREYGACKIAGIYTKQPPYSHCIQHNQNGLLVNHTAEGWYTAIKLLIEDQVLRNQIAKAAYLDVKTNYTHEAIVKLWKEIIGKQPYSKNVYAQLRIKLVFIQLKAYGILINFKMQRTFYFYRYHGFIPTCKKILQTMVNSCKIH